MGKRFDETLAALRQAVEEPASPAARKRIIKALSGNNGLLVAVATAAAVTADDEESDPRIDQGLLERLAPAFTRLLHDPVKRDPQCQGKVAIAKALRRAEVCPEEVFVVGARHVQREPVWGGSVDTAAELRGICGMVLLEEHHPRALVEVAHLLADPEAAARTAGARALGSCGRADVAEPLLRFRIEAGEDEAEVIGECFGALLQVAPGPSLPYVVEYLGRRDDGVAEAAALALGSSRLSGALAPLCEQAERTVTPQRRAVVLLAIAMLRTEDAWAWLTSQIETAPRGLAAGALQALATFKHDTRLHARVSEAVARRSDGALETEFEQSFF